MNEPGEFTLTFDPEPSQFPYYPNGYWHCYAEPGWDGDGTTPENAMAACIIAMSKELRRCDDPDEPGMYERDQPGTEEVTRRDTDAWGWCAPDHACLGSMGNGSCPPHCQYSVDYGTIPLLPDFPTPPTEFKEALDQAWASGAIPRGRITYPGKSEEPPAIVPQLEEFGPDIPPVRVVSGECSCGLCARYRGES